MKVLIKMTCLLLLSLNFTFAETYQVSAEGNIAVEKLVDRLEVISKNLYMKNGNAHGMSYYHIALQGFESEVKDLKKQHGEDNVQFYVTESLRRFLSSAEGAKIVNNEKFALKLEKDLSEQVSDAHQRPLVGKMLIGVAIGVGITALMSLDGSGSPDEVINFGLFMAALGAAVGAGYNQVSDFIRDGEGYVNINELISASNNEILDIAN